MAFGHPAKQSPGRGPKQAPKPVVRPGAVKQGGPGKSAPTGAGPLKGGPIKK
jgi:hypothetical protein